MQSLLTQNIVKHPKIPSSIHNLHFLFELYHTQCQADKDLCGIQHRHKLHDTQSDIDFTNEYGELRNICCVHIYLSCENTINNFFTLQLAVQMRWKVRNPVCLVRLIFVKAQHFSRHSVSAVKSVHVDYSLNRLQSGHFVYSLLSFKILVFVIMKSLIVVSKVTFWQHRNMLLTRQTHSCPLHTRKYIRNCPPFLEHSELFIHFFFFLTDVLVH